MEHKKTFQSIVYDTAKGPIIIEGPLQSSQFTKLKFHNHLTAFRPAKKQFEAIRYIPDQSEGRIIVARTENTIIGYVTFHYPDPLERWSAFKMDNLIVLGAIEVIPEYRKEHIASQLLKLSMIDKYMENYIIISTEYHWHWDLDGTKLNIWEYQKVMEKIMAAGGLFPQPTDDPEIISHPANRLMVRIGANVPRQSIEQFDKLRFLRRHDLN